MGAGRGIGGSLSAMLTHWHWRAKAGTVGKVMGIDIPTRGRYKITIAYWESPWPACAGVLLTCCPEMIFTNQAPHSRKSGESEK